MQSVDIQPGRNGNWKSGWTFIFAAVGSAVGLGNIWKFPYIAGENGGGAFILVYMVCIALIGLPIMMAEVLLGRRGRMSPINAMLVLSRESGVSRWWAVVGWLGVVAGILILSFYSVIAGWAIHYFLLAASGGFDGLDFQTSDFLFSGFLENTGALTLWHSLFLLATLLIVAAGVIKGLGMAVRSMMPLLLVLLLVLMIYSGTVGDAGAALGFLFNANFGALTWNSVLVAMGHAFFTLSLGMGAIMAYGAYMPYSADPSTAAPVEKSSPRRVSLGTMVAIITLLDTLVALMAGLVIFPIVFADSALQPGAGPGLLFVSLPVAFGGMAGGSLFGAVFFLLVIIAALSSAISLIEPTVAWLVETRGYRRLMITACLGSVIWLIGLGTVFSFNRWSGMTFFGNTFFGNLDFLTTNIMLPLGGMLIAIFVGWRMKPELVAQEVGNIRRGLYRWWFLVLRYLSPMLLGWVFIMALIDRL